MSVSFFFWNSFPFQHYLNFFFTTKANDIYESAVKYFDKKLSASEFQATIPRSVLNPIITAMAQIVLTRKEAILALTCVK